MMHRAVSLVLKQCLESYKYILKSAYMFEHGQRPSVGFYKKKFAHYIVIFNCVVC
jgi:hypothetical protein